jgi:GR25 family glycosyltransferase involved in LPS biosynthesis
MPVIFSSVCVCVCGDCFLTVCQVVERGYNEVMVLEDDIRFEPFFRQKVSHMMAEMQQLQLDWDLV